MRQCHSDQAPASTTARANATAPRQTAIDSQIMRASLARRVSEAA
jgi:hypothetical protein